MPDAKIEEVEPCPFCDRTCESLLDDDGDGMWYVACTSDSYRTPGFETETDAVDAHNRVSRAAMKESKNG